MKNDVLVRLRAGNPFPDPAVALRPVGGRRPRSYRRPILIVAVALVAVAVLASTAFAISQWIGGDVVKPPVTLAEYRAAQHELAVPPGFEWPTLRVDPNSVTTRGGGGGYAVSIAQNAWECYWAGAIRTGDPVAASRAHAQLETLLRANVIVAPAGASENWAPPNSSDRPIAVYADDGGYEWVARTYALAAAGHPERLIGRCAANASG